MKLVVRHGERTEEVEVRRTADGYEVTVGGVTHRVDAAQVGDGMRSLRIDDAQHEVGVFPVPSRGGPDGRYRVSRRATLPADEVEVLDPLTHLARESRGGAGAGAAETVTAMMPGRVVAVLVEEGAEVEAGQGVVVLEAMKMENEIAAEHAGTIARIHVAEGQAVEGGEPLFEVG